MKKIILFLLIFILGQNFAKAHTCENETVKCPIDGNKVTFCVTMSMTTFGSYKDFQKQGAIGNHYEELINSCSKCYYSGYIDDFKLKFNKDQIDRIKSVLSNHKETKIDNAQQCLIAAEIKQVLNKPKNKIAFCYVTGSYLLRGEENKTKLRKEFQLKAKDNLILSLENNEYDDNTVIPNINYLIAEMLRRIGSFGRGYKIL